jgi:monoamine oxidase
MKDEIMDGAAGDRLTRRDLLKIGGAGGLATALGAVAGRTSQARLAIPRQRPPDNARYDVVVVGGGVSGAYVAWRLLEDDPSRRVALCELSERIGGRLLSVTPPGAPHLRAELGGMRLLNTQEQVVRLIEHLDLTVDRFPMGDTRNLVYLRGRHWTQADWQDRHAVPYVLTPDAGTTQRPIDERGKSPDELLRTVVEWHAPDAAHYGPTDWQHFKETATVDIEGIERPLHDVGFWNLVLETLSSEGYQLVRDGGGYYSVPGNWSAADALPWMWADFVGATYQKIRDGFLRLPLEMVDRFQRAGGELLPLHELRLLRPSNDGAPGSLEATFLRGPERAPWRCRAGHVLLALPRRAIELLDPETFLFANPQFVTDLDTVTPEAAAKTFLLYSQPWWEEQLGLQSGRSISDLPIRQTYYFGTEGDQPGADPGNRTSLLMASYTDGPPVDFWRGYIGGPPFTDTPVDGVAAELVASAAMTAETERQVAELHGSGVSIPPAELALHIDWGRDPYGAAWHFWRPGTKSWEVMARMRRPDAAVNVHICGEAWSTGQGWVQGALATAEQVLQQELGLDRPEWLPAQADIGPA